MRARNKKIKAQYNSLCTATIFCEMNSIVLTAGNPGFNLIDVNDKGITIQTNAEQSLNLMTDNMYGPYYEWNTNPFSLFLPMIGNTFPRATLQIPFADNSSDIASAVAIFGIISGV
jgi:hypothetical protein